MAISGSKMLSSPTLRKKMQLYSTGSTWISNLDKYQLLSGNQDAGNPPSSNLSSDSTTPMKEQYTSMGLISRNITSLG